MPRTANAHLPIIGIVPSQEPAESFLQVRSAYIDAITTCGGAPIILPITNDKRVYETLFPLMDGFILTGGQDVSPERYHEHATTDKLSETTPLREEVECLILSYAYKYDVPTLGICRGMQMMNVFFGGTLYQDLGDQFGGREAAHPDCPTKHWQSEAFSNATHFVNIIRDSKLGELLQTDQLATNSMHHQGVNEIAPLLRPAAYGPDGLVEAIEMPSRTYIMGVQWHPEYFAAKSMKCIFTALITEAARARRSGRITMDPLRFIRDDGSNRWRVCRFAPPIEERPVIEPEEEEKLKEKRGPKGKSGSEHA